MEVITFVIGVVTGIYVTQTLKKYIDDKVKSTIEKLKKTK